MELDELKTLWKETHHRLAAIEPALRLNQRLALAGTLDRTRSKLRLVQVVLWYEIGFGLLAALLLGSYLFDNIGTLQFALPAAGLHLAAILTIGMAAWQLMALGQIDYAGPVMAIQRRLAELRVVRARSNRWLLVSTPLLWSLLIVVVPHGLFGFDVYRGFGFPWLAANLGLGIAVLGSAAWASRRLSAGFRGSAFLRWLGEDVTGGRVALASGFLDDLAEFEREE